MSTLQKISEAQQTERALLLVRYCNNKQRRRLDYRDRVYARVGGRARRVMQRLEALREGRTTDLKITPDIREVRAWGILSGLRLRPGVNWLGRALKRGFL